MKTGVNRETYQQRIEAGACVRCGAARDADDPRMCGRCRQAVREADRARRRAMRGVKRLAEHVVRRAPDEPPPERTPVRCRKCCDQPWRRPVAGCPACGEPHGAEAVEPVWHLAEARHP
jgi:hypothetical protein